MVIIGVGKGISFHVYQAFQHSALHQASNELNIKKRVTPQTIRYSFSSYQLDDGYDIRTVHELLGT